MILVKIHKELFFKTFDILNRHIIKEASCQSIENRNLLFNAKRFVQILFKYFNRRNICVSSTSEPFGDCTACSDTICLTMYVRAASACAFKASISKSAGISEATTPMTYSTKR